MAKFKQSAVIFDLDGVLCDNAQALHDYIETHPNPSDTLEYWAEWYEQIGSHKPSPDFMRLAQLLRDAGHLIIVLTARSGHLMKETLDWLDDCEAEYDFLKMVPPGDGNFHISKELILQDLLKEYNIVFAIDDSLHWCAMYRRYDIPTLHVNHGLRSTA